MNMKTPEQPLLKKLAVAITENPRATTGALAKAAGISRATLNRFCGSRDNLMQMITAQARTSLEEIIRIANVSDEFTEASLCELIRAHFENHEALVFMCETQNGLDDEIWNAYLSAMDIFIANGQQAGAFRRDFTTQMLSELLISTICGVIDADRRGRITAVEKTELVISFFMNGASAR